MGYAMRIGERQVTFDDLTPAAWQRVDDAGSVSWADAYLAPLRSLDSAMQILRECIATVEPDCDAGTRANELAPSIKALSELIVEVEDDMPSEIRDGIPTVGDAENSTSI